jgi:diaminopimelate epimerase
MPRPAGGPKASRRDRPAPDGVKDALPPSPAADERPQPRRKNGRYRVTIADPAGNLTALIESADTEPVAAWTDAERRDIVRQVMREYPDVEQTGFVVPGESVETGRLWRLEMAGGEFCGNAARSFGLFVAQKEGLHGKATVRVALSGAENPLAVFADTENNEAEVGLPLPRTTGTVRYRGKHLPALVYDGITHVIMEGIDKNADKAALAKTFFEIKQTAEAAPDTAPPAALGVMFYDTASAFLRPAVFVSGVETFVFEHSCGSGSAAFAYNHALHLPDGEYRMTVQQPGGAIKTRVIKQNGKTVSVFIGGKVFFR